MNTLYQTLACLCALSLLAGCDQLSRSVSSPTGVQVASTPSSNPASPVIDEKEAALKAWKKFAGTVRANCKAVAEFTAKKVNESRRADGRNDQDEEDLQVIRDDVRQSQSLKSPFTGEIVLKQESRYLQDGDLVNSWTDTKTFIFEWTEGKWDLLEYSGEQRKNYGEPKKWGPLSKENVIHSDYVAKFIMQCLR